MKESRILGQRISVILTATKVTVRNFRGTDEVRHIWPDFCLESIKVQSVKVCCSRG